MKGHDLLDSVGGIDAKHIQSAEATKKQKKLPISRIAAAAACLCLIAAGIAAIFPRPQEKLPADTLQSMGLDFEIAEESVVGIVSGEIPQIGRKELVDVLNNSTIIDCTIEKIDRIKIKDPESSSVWYITIMELSRNGVLRGEFEETRFSVVNAAVTNFPAEFFSDPTIQDCREQMRAAFILREASNIWTIGTAKVNAKLFGDYSVAWCLELDGDTLQYQQHRIKLSELE